MPIEVSHTPLLLLSSLIVAIMGSFTALRLTSNLRHASVKTRKIRVSQGAIALGTSIWSMHFIAMLAVKMSVAISYDPSRTLASALLAVLVVGIAFLSLHFGVRTKMTILVAGVLTGFGIAGMHYLGMSAISDNVMATYSPFGVALAISIGIFASIFALVLAYGDRSILSISIGSAILGFAISAMHHTAMRFTKFTGSGVDISVSTSALNNEILALIVMVASFVLSGMFLLLALPFGHESDGLPRQVPAELQYGKVLAERERKAESSASSERAKLEKIGSIKIPYEQNNVVKYLSAVNIHAVQAEGHYTHIYDGRSRLFCPWSISRLEASLDPAIFTRVHRSYLVNTTQIVGIKRNGDKSVCIVGADAEIEIPIARTQVTELKKRLQLG